MASVTLRNAQKENKKAKSEHSFPPFFFFKLLLGLGLGLGWGKG